MSISRPATLLVLTAMLCPAVTRAQRTARSGAATSSTKKNTTVVNIRLRVDQIAGSSSSRARGGNALNRGLKTALTGDKNKVAAARTLAVAEAQRAAPARNTLIVLIGGASELQKVSESLSEVRRPITLAFADVDYAEDEYDNTALKSGLAGSVTDLADNLLVFLPRNGAPRGAKPDHVLSTRVANAALWNGMFAMDGDELDLDMVTAALPKGEQEQSSTALVAGTPAAPPAPGAMSAGDVVAPKVNGIKVYASASSDSKVVGTVGKDDELVIDAAEQNGFVKVEGSVSGWIKTTLLSKR